MLRMHGISSLLCYWCAELLACSLGLQAISSESALTCHACDLNGK